MSEPRPDTEIHREIVATLTAFATNVTRYYYLEALAAGGNRDLTRDPIAMWQTRVTQRVLAHYTDAQRSHDQARALAIEASAGHHMVVRSIAETGDPITSVADLTIRTAEAQVARRWERMYVLQLCQFLGTVIEGFGARAQANGLPVPFLTEFFYMFRLSDRDFRNRKVWSIH